MPGFDRSGPMGAGPMTGGGRGFCSRNTASGAGFGYGGGRGMGRGFRGGFGGWRGSGYGVAPAVGTATEPDEIRYLQATAEELRASLGRIEQRLAELSSDNNE